MAIPESQLETRAKQGATVTAKATHESIRSALIYQYQNNPKAHAIDTMQIHYGTTKLTLTGSALEGEYYSGRDRQHFGSLVLKKSLALPAK